MHAYHQQHLQSPSGYEFNDIENRGIAKVAGRTRGWGIVSIIAGVAQIILGVVLAIAMNPFQATYVVAGVIAIVVGVFFLKGASGLQAVVDTQGQDVPHLMNALGQLSKSFLIQAIATTVGLFVMVAVFVIGFIVGMTQSM